MSRNLSHIPIILKPVRFSYILKSYFFKNVLASSVLYNCISIYCGHSQNIKSVLQNQPLRTGSVSMPFYIIILHMNT